MVKKMIREQFIEKRNAIDIRDIVGLEEEMVTRFESLALQGIQQLLSYYPISERREFNVTVCEQILALENTGLQVHLPKLQYDELKMEAVKITSETLFSMNRFNIPEPESDDITDPQLIDAVFVPLLAFDTKGYRVG